MTPRCHPERRAEERNHENDKKFLQKVFERIDEDGSGELTLEELVEGARQEGRTLGGSGGAADEDAGDGGRSTIICDPIKAQHCS